MYGALFFTVILIVFNLNVNVIEGRADSLSYDFYQQSCPQLEDIVQAGFRSIALLDPTFSSVVLRLMFHDCEVQGCDASILLDSDEINSDKNFAVRKREQIGHLKAQVERSCPGIVSCADILILAGREAVSMSLGPRITVPLGRRDTTEARTAQDADAAIPAHDLGVDGTLKLFEEKGLSVEESVAFIGAHTLGVVHCRNIDPNLGRQGELARSFELSLSLKCPRFGELLKNTTFVQNDPTSFIFDNLYFSNAMRGRGLLQIDAELPTDPRTAPYVQRFAADQGEFFRVFSEAFVKVTSYGVLTGEQGNIRNQCNTIN